MLMTIIFLLLIVLLGTFIVVGIKRQNGQATPRRYDREPPLNESLSLSVHEPRVSSQSSASLEPEKPKDRVKPMTQKTIEQDVPDYISLHVMAPREYPYNGYELLQALLTNGLRYGDRNIFHRHETKTGRGRVLFSLASVNKPGTFELDR